MAMADPIRLDAMGVAIDLHLADGRSETVRPLVEAAWSRCLRPDDGEEPDVSLDVVLGEPSDEAGADADADRVVAAATSEHLMELLSQEVTVAAVSVRAGELVMLHACGLADPRTGRTLLLVAPSGTGKTTLARTLGHRWGYVTDETGAVELDGRLLAYPKPLSVVTEGEHKVQMSPDELGLAHPPGDLTVAGIWLLDRQPGVDRAARERVALVDAVALLAEQTSYLTFLEAPLTQLAELVQTIGGVSKVTYSDAEQLRPLVDRFLGGAS